MSGRERARGPLLAVAAAVLLALPAFITTGGEQVPSALNTWVEIVLVALAAGVVAMVIARGAPGPAHGRTAVCWFVALAVLSAVSIAWSVAGDLSWIEANRTAGYLAAFVAAAGLARLFPQHWRALVAGAALAMVAITVFALVVKVFTLPVSEQTEYGRLLTPFDYWNATGVVAAMGLPLALWAGSRRRGPLLLRGLAPAAVTVLIAVIVLTYSRSAVLAGVTGVAVVLPFTASRMRQLAVLLIGGAGAAVVSVWALAQQAITNDEASQLMSHVAVSARTAAGHRLGLVLLITLVVVAAAGTAAVLAADRLAPPASWRRGADLGLLGGVAMLPVLAVLALAASSRGLTGEVSHIWRTLTVTGAGVGDSANRLLSLSNSRPEYWRQGWSVGTHHLLGGAGPGTFGISHLRYRTALLTVQNGVSQDVSHAHSYVIETFAGLGLLGVLVNLGLLIAWFRAALRTAGHRLVRLARPLQDPHAEERDASWALIGVVVALGFSSAIDWTWFFPGVAIPALVCAGWVAGRGPLAAPVGRVAPGKGRALSARPGAIVGVTVLTLVTLAICWEVWQPLRSYRYASSALSAISQGDGSRALSDAQRSVSTEPVAVMPLRTLSTIYSDFGQPADARRALVKATTVQPANPQPWCWLGVYELSRRQFSAAARSLDRSIMLDLTNSLGQQQLRAAALSHQQPASMVCGGGA